MESSTDQTTTWLTAIRRSWLNLIPLVLLAVVTVRWPPSDWGHWTVRALGAALLLLQFAYRVWQMRRGR